jgi:hypothetical protein
METAAKKISNYQHVSKKPLRQQKKQQQQRQQQKGGVIKVNLKDPNQVKPLLDAQVHLVSIDVDRDEMNEAPDDTYAGITAEFCKLDFAIQKKDPSSGKLLFFALQNICENWNERKKGNTNHTIVFHHGFLFV